MREHVRVASNNRREMPCKALSYQSWQRGFDSESIWKELGLTSVAHAELSGVIEERLHVKLSSNCDELYATQSELRTFLEDWSCQPFPVKLPHFCIIILLVPCRLSFPVPPRHLPRFAAAASHGFLYYGIRCRKLWSDVGVLP